MNENEFVNRTVLFAYIAENVSLSYFDILILQNNSLLFSTIHYLCALISNMQIAFTLFAMRLFSSRLFSNK